MCHLWAFFNGLLGELLLYYACSATRLAATAHIGAHGCNVHIDYPRLPLCPREYPFSSQNSGVVCNRLQFAVG